MCTADSLLQRMGRCNRKVRYCPNEANIVVFDNRNGFSEGKRRSVYEDKLYDRSLELLSKYEHILFSEDKKTAYMNEVYSVDGVKETIYFENIQKDFCIYYGSHTYAFCTACTKHIRCHISDCVRKLPSGRSQINMGYDKLIPRQFFCMVMGFEQHTEGLFQFFCCPDQFIL